MDQPKVERLLRLMQMMSGTRFYTIPELMDALDMSERTIFRYISTFREVGFSVTRRTDTPRLITTNRRGLDIDQMVCFSREEAFIVNSLIDRLDATNTLKSGLKKKLSNVLEQTPMANFVDNRSNAVKLDALSNAIAEKKCVILHEYESGITLETRDRLVEPFEFTTNCIEVWAYEKESGICKTFMISRIKEVEILKDDWEYEEQHKSKPQDIFRMCSDTVEHIKVRLTSLAKNVLLEEYPLSAQFISETEPPEYDSKLCWTLETDICSVFGAGRFVLGFASDVEVLEGEELKKYVRMVTEKFIIPDYFDDLSEADS